jgi:hypothetical protein
MGRKAREDRASVHGVHLGLRLTPELASMLHAVLERANMVATTMGLPPNVTASSLVRRWIEERLRAEMGSADQRMLMVGGRAIGALPTATGPTKPKSLPQHHKDVEDALDDKRPRKRK